eukprot:TRINITY_DN1286_c0_g1_i1.p1 TRINITY_DN1286_c0_g1~~TRINITY_DN1286_c0_g1_i1.p1  ORF type:complete len:343 (+),score=100.20 TRINITY_DN1286_c0_g1_i1:114-1142(+)
MSNGIMLKVSFGDEIRRFPLATCRYSALEETIRGMFSFSAEQKLKVQYQDDEKDWINLSSDQELELAVQLSSIVRLRVDVGYNKPAVVQARNQPMQVDSLFGVPSYESTQNREAMETDQPRGDRREAKIHARVERRNDKFTQKVQRKQAKMDCKFQRKMDKLQRKYDKMENKKKKTRLANIFVTDEVYSCAPGEQIIKVVKLRNDTNAVWPEACNFVYVDGVQLSQIKSISVPALQPGFVFEISIPITAPMEDGKYVTCYQLVGLSGTPFAKPYKLKTFVGQSKKKYQTIPNAEELIASLVSMGFQDRSLNEKLVHRCNGDLDKVVMKLAKKNMKHQKKYGH